MEAAKSRSKKDAFTSFVNCLKNNTMVLNQKQKSTRFTAITTWADTGKIQLAETAASSLDIDNHYFLFEVSLDNMPQTF